MAKARNKVIKGDYEGRGVGGVSGKAYIVLGFTKSEQLNPDTVESYEVLDQSSTKSASSAIIRGGIGAALLGPVGIAAALSAKNKGIHLVAIQFKDGKKSLLEVDEKIFKHIQTALF